MRLDVQQCGNLLMGHTFKHRQAEHTSVALWQRIYGSKDFLQGKRGFSMTPCCQCLGLSQCHVLLLLPQVLQGHVLCHFMHPCLNTGCIFQFSNLRKDQKECVMQQVVGYALVLHISHTDGS